jgi:hypothetical protein
VSGADLVLLHAAALHAKPLLSSDAVRVSIDSLGEMTATRSRDLKKHFRIVITRRGVANRAGEARLPSLFSPRPILDPIAALGDPYASLLCDILANLPKIENVPSVTELLARLRAIAPLFLDQKFAGQAEPVLWYATSIVPTQESLVARIGAVVDDRDLITLRATDKVCGLQSQHQRVNFWLAAVRAMRANLQTHLNLFLTEIFVKGPLCQAMKEAIVHVNEFATDIGGFQRAALNVMKVAHSLAGDKLSETGRSQISRVLFYKLTEQLTLKRYLQQDQPIWKKSIIINTAMEQAKAQLLERIAKAGSEVFVLKKSYLTRASELL